MANEEPAELVNALKHCTHCDLDGMHTFLFFNNKQESQPRYECLGCRRRFTQGGVAYHKARRKTFKSRTPPPAPCSPPGTSTSSPPREPTPPRPRRPSEADHVRARARMARDAAQELAAGGAESASAGAQVVTGVRVTRWPSGVVPVPPRKHLKQVTTKVAGQTVVSCILLDSDSGN
jgi:hypothetical protein